MLENNTDYQNNLLQQLAYCDLENATIEPGTSLIEALNYEENDENCQKLAIQMEAAGLTDLVIVDYDNRNETIGFVGIAFEDSSGARGMSIRGTEHFGDLQSDVVGFVNGERSLWDVVNNQIDMIDNGMTALSGDSLQAQAAIDFFEKNKNPDGNNQLYLHSKSGELGTHIALEYPDEIQKVHMLNPQPTNAYLLTEEQIAFLNSDKFDVMVVDGDFVWLLGSVPYKLENIRFIQNNGEKDGFAGPHTPQSASFDPVTGEAIIENFPYVKYIQQGAVGTLVCILLSTIQDKTAPYTKLTKEIEEPFRQYVKNNPESVEAMYRVVISVYDQSKEHLGIIQSNVESIVGMLGNAVDEWMNFAYAVARGYIPTTTYFEVDTYKLRTYASRIEAVNRQIVAIDNRIDALYKSVGLQGLMSLMQADILTTYSYRLKKVASYLNDTAVDFENVENELVNT